MSPSSLISRRLLLCRTCRHIWRNPIYVNTAPLCSSSSVQRAFSTRREDESQFKEQQYREQQHGEQKHEEKQRAGQSLEHTRKGARLKYPKKYNLYITAAFFSSAAVMYLGWSDTPSNSKIFDRPHFTTFTIISREELSPTNIILTLRPSIPATPTSDPYHANWERGTWSVEFKQPQLQIARSYTPLPPLLNTQNGDLRFLIRKECKGEVSSYLHSLPVGASVDLRGPNEEIAIPGEVTDIVFLAGGTGIAPALQVAHTLLDVRGEREDGTKPRIRIVWANRQREECQGGDDITSRQSSMPWQSKPTTDEVKPHSLLVRELQEMQKKHPNQLMIEYLVDEEGTFIDQKRITNLIRLSNSGRVSSVKSLPLHESIDKKLIFVSGPEGFVNFFAGPKKWEGASGIEGQGEVGGVIGRMRLRDWKLWKL